MLIFATSVCHGTGFSSHRNKWKEGREGGKEEESKQNREEDKIFKKVFQIISIDIEILNIIQKFYHKPVNLVKSENIRIIKINCFFTQ